MPDQFKPLPPPRVFIETPTWCACRNCQRLVAKGFDPCIVWTPRILPPFDAAVVERLVQACKVHLLGPPPTWEGTFDAWVETLYWRVVKTVLVAALGEGVVTG